MFRRAVPIILFGVMIFVGTVGYAFLRAPAAASAPIEAIPLQIAATGDAAANTPSTFEIAPDQSQARFVIDEVLRGSPNTVIGATSQVAGQIAVDPTQPSNAQFGAILINARTLATDDDLRNNAIRRFILSTDQYQYISFTPTSVQGLPSTTTLGQAYPFQIVGQLTIQDVTREVTFDATVTPVSATRLEGNATTSIPYTDWGISIPQVPFVASVSDQVRLELTFVATTA